MYHERQQLQRCLLHTLNNLLQRPAWSVASLNALCDTIHASRTRWVGNYDANVLAAALQQHSLEVKWHDSRDTQLTSLDLTETQPDTQKDEGTDSRGGAAPAQQEPTVPPQPPQQHGGRGGAQSQSQQDLQSHQHQSKQQQDQQPQQQLQSHEHQQHQQPEQQQQGPQPQQQHKQEEQQQEQQDELVGLVLNVAGGGLLSRLLGGRHWLAIRRLQGAWWNLDSQLQQPVRFGTATAAAAAAAGSSTECLRAYLQQQLAAGAHLLLVTRPAGSSRSSDSGGIAESCCALVGS